MEDLGEMNALFHGLLRLLEDPDQSPTDRELADTFRNAAVRSRIAEKEIHAVILSSVRARREVLRQSARDRGPLH